MSEAGHADVVAPEGGDTGQRLVEAARAMGPLLASEREEGERVGTLTPAVVEALEQAGVFRTFVPRELGGLEVHPVEWMDMVEELSYHDPSAGWIAMINAGTFAQFLTPEVHQKLAGMTGGRFIVSQNFGRVAGVATLDDGGYRITGRWPFVSGSPHATWVGGGAIWYENDEPKIAQDGLPWVIHAIWPAEQATLIDNWDGLGLRASGSWDMEIEDLFVPNEQINLAGMHRMRYDRPLFRMREMLFMAHSAHAIGIARFALDAFLEETKKKQLRGSVRQEKIGQPYHQIVYAKADALVRASRTFANHAVSEAYTWLHKNRGQILDYDLRVQLRQSMIFSVRSCREAVQHVFDSAGSAAVYTGRPLERAWRDMATAANHLIVTDSEYASIGSYHLTKHQPDGPTINGRGFW